MKFTIEVIINQPRTKVIELFDNPENLKKWQPDLVSFKNVRGERRQEGSKSELIYGRENGQVVMSEYITKRNLPDEIHGIYEATNIYNEIENYFTEIDKNTTKWTAKHDFKLQGWQRIFTLVAKTPVKIKSQSIMQTFKKFAESN